MSRDQTDEDVPLPPHGRPPAIENRKPCRPCGTLTLVSTLNHYGSRCFSCYEAFCQSRQPRPAFMGDKRVGPRSWVDALQRRKDSGEALTQAQLEMLRAAKRHEGWTGGNDA
jgi:hypothetical protein